MAKDQSEHRRTMEKWKVIGGTLLPYFGVICAFIIALFALHQGAALMREDHEIGGSIFGGSGVGLAALVGTFIKGTRLRGS
jgi:hypothetical protein